jgi:adenylate kinase family enzyme
MSPKLIIIRGNSGSGKSSIARIVRDELGENTMLVPQDIVRREILHVKDRLDNPAIELIQKIVLYGKEIGYNVVLEGILSKKLYGDMLDELIIEFGDDTHIFYMDVSFEETLKRHNTKPNKDEYGAEKMKEWWLEKDYLSIKSEKVIPEIFSISDSTDFILKSLR